MKRSFFSSLCLCILCCCSFPETSLAQLLNGVEFDFVKSNDILNSGDFRSDFVIGISDINQDGLDDILRFKNGATLEIRYQQPDGRFTELKLGDINNNNEVWNVAVGDADNNGVNDIITGDSDKGEILFTGEDAGLSFVRTKLPEVDSIFVQGANFVDIDTDGDLDIFVCHDEGRSQTYRNDGMGNYTLDTTMMPLSLFTPLAMNAGNYSSLWTDIDNDKDLDLYISKCFADATTVTDPRRINQLFLNDGNNQFQEVAAERGVANGEQTWVTEFMDFDNDGDMDCIMIDHSVDPNGYMSYATLWENDGKGYFTDITPASGIFVTKEQGEMLQCIARDFDSDGWIDIIIAGNYKDVMYRNNGDKTFSVRDDVFDYFMSSMAAGDLNHDGYPDLYSSSWASSDALWINDNVSNHFLSLSLQGTNCNSNAIGARIKLYGPWGVQTRDVRSGESYGIMNSMTQLIGLGSHTKVDSLLVYWPAPSNRVDKFEDISADQFLKIVEGDCVYTDDFIDASSLFICENGSAMLTAPPAQSYLWSNGDTTASIQTSSDNNSYSVLLTNEFGCSSSTDTIQLTVLVPPVLMTQNDTIEGPGTATLTVQGNGESLQWFDEDGTLVGQGDTLSIDINESTTFFVESVISRDSVQCTKLQAVEAVVQRPDFTIDLEQAGISLFPNPVHSQLTIANKGQTTIHNIRLFQQDGRLLRSFPAAIPPASQKAFSLQDIPNGLYLLELSQSERIISTKLLIQR